MTRADLRASVATQGESATVTTKSGDPHARETSGGTVPRLDSAPALAVVQARMSSSRLPGKTLADIDGEPALALLLRRLKRARGIGEIVVATSTDASDDPVAELAAQLGAGVMRGPLADVLARFVLALGSRVGPIVRVTGDCPMIDPHVVDLTVECFLSVPGCAYASNVAPRTYPDGLDVEVVDADALRELDREDLTPGEREHVGRATRRAALSRRRGRDPARDPHCPLAGNLCWRSPGLSRRL
jgi:spore coat polysaccharide biosynthesis protein SpsF (cytidylyltransferase family)